MIKKIAREVCKELYGSEDAWLYLRKMFSGGGDLPWQTFTGNPVSFNAPKAHQFKSFSFDIEPVQDLHGYDYPWPAGGGKNKLEITGQSASSNGTTVTINSDGSIRISGTPSATTTFALHSGTFWESSVAATFARSTTPTGIRVYCTETPSGGSASYPTLTSAYSLVADANYKNL